jgi:hypothetical protein
MQLPYRLRTGKDCSEAKPISRRTHTPAPREQAAVRAERQRVLHASRGGDDAVAAQGAKKRPQHEAVVEVANAQLPLQVLFVFPGGPVETVSRL